jgi:hypothetical protein
MGVDRVNRKLAAEKDGAPLWRRVLTGEDSKAAFRAQMVAGIKRATPRKPKRKLWKVGKCA